MRERNKQHPHEFESLTVGGLGEIFDGPHATPTRRGSGDKYFLNISSLQSGRLDLSASDYIDDADFATWTRRVQPRTDDLLFSYETRLGEAALMPGGVAACLGRRMALIRPNRDVVDPRFLLYFWLSPAFRATIEQRSIRGATVDRIPLGDLASWPARIPPLQIQRAIADVLGALDDKIAANLRLIVAADNLAGARHQALPRLTRNTTLGELLRLKYGKALPATHRVPGTTIVVGSSGKVGTHDTPLFSGPSVIVGRKGSVGQVHWFDGPTYPIDTTYVVEPVAAAPLMYLYYLLRTIDFANMSSDSAVPGLNRERAYAVEVPDVSAAAIKRFADEATPLLKRISTTRTESHRLAATRDELLPLLMSGRITVRDAERRVEDEV